MPYMMCVVCDRMPVKVDGDSCNSCKDTTDAPEIAAWERQQARDATRASKRAAKPTPASEAWAQAQGFQDDDMFLFLEGGDVENEFEDGEHIGLKIFLKFTKIDWGTIKNDPQVERHELLLPLGAPVQYYWRKPQP
jgi:hypothetical protein